MRNLFQFVSSLEEALHVHFHKMLFKNGDYVCFLALASSLIDILFVLLY